MERLGTHRKEGQWAGAMREALRRSGDMEQGWDDEDREWGQKIESDGQVTRGKKRRQQTDRSNRHLQPHRRCKEQQHL